jgi:Cd2+/Zn2+-exporting ATPase/Cu+-exporting ATPase
MEGDQNEEHQPEWREIARITFVMIAVAAVWFRVWEPYSTVIGLIAVVVGIFPILKEALALERGMTMQL